MCLARDVQYRMKEKMGMSTGNLVVVVVVVLIQGSST